MNGLQKNKRYCIQILACVAAVLTLAGCGGQDAPNSSDPATSTTGSTETTTTTSESASNGDTADGKSTSTSSKLNNTSASSSASKSSSNTTKKSTSTTGITTTTKKKPVDLSMFPVKQTMSIQEAAAKVNNNLSAPMTKIKSESSVVWKYDKNYTYNMHGGLAIFKGKLYASYSRGLKDEDAPGQHVVITSTPLSNLNQWSKPKIIGPAVQHSDGIHQTSNINGWLYTDGEKLFAYYAIKEYPASAWRPNGAYIIGQHSATWIGMCTFTTDGVNWCEPFAVPTSLANEAVRQSLTGQWFAGRGNGLLCSYEETPNVIWQNIGPSSSQIEDALKRGAKSLPESSWYQTNDYVLHHMIRSSAGQIWMSNSYDNGKTWTDVYPTNFKADDAMPNFGRLPDGRCYFVGTTSGGIDRIPLQLYVSKDGYNFNTGYILRDEKYAMQMNGAYKHGYYSYPEVRFDDTYMYILYSKQKELMEVTRVKLTDIK